MYRAVSRESTDEDGHLTLRRSRRAAVRWPAASAARFGATRGVAQPRAKGRTRLSGRTLGGYAPNVRSQELAPSAPAHDHRLCWGLLAPADLLRWGSCREWRAPLHEEPPGALSVPRKVFMRGSHYAQSSSRARNRQREIGPRSALMPRSTRAAQPRAALTAAGTALLPRRSAAKKRG